jgi:hypothetical protein
MRDAPVGRPLTAVVDPLQLAALRTGNGARPQHDSDRAADRRPQGVLGAAAEIGVVHELGGHLHLDLCLVLASRTPGEPASGKGLR